MPIHDWGRVFPGTFHDFHMSWITQLKDALNDGLLPEGYYALSDQQATDVSPDVLTLRATEESRSEGPTQGVLVLDEAPPKVSIRMEADEATAYSLKRRTLVIRHRTSRRIVAMIEILSPGNKEGRQRVEEFVDKAVGAIRQGIHLLIVDVHPAGTSDPDGLHGEIWPFVGGGDFRLPEGKPLTVAAYLAEQLPEAFVEPLAVGDALPDMPLFLADRRYILAPLEKTYMTAYTRMPKIVRDIVEGRAPAETV